MIFPTNGVQKFKLAEGFILPYITKQVPWGMGELSYIVYKRTYARPVHGENRSEEWWETCRRVIEGMFTIQKIHCRNLGLHWDNRKAQATARDAYDRLFNLKWTPPGRGLWAMGTDFLFERGSASLNNCAFVSTQNIAEDPAEPFHWLFNMSMYGVGVGFDVLGADKVKVVEPKISEEPHVVEDSKEGWGDLLYRAISAFTGRGSLPSVVDYSHVRPEGSPILTFGGIAPGPEPLRQAYERVVMILTRRIGQTIDEETIVDLANIFGVAVVSGGVRRSSEIALGKSEKFSKLKRRQDESAAWYWASNNTIIKEADDEVIDYDLHVKNIEHNGEPGFFMLNNARAFGRMNGIPNFRDRRAKGTNPCGEQTLEDHELCCLVENYIARHDSLEDFIRTLKISYMYAKTVTLVPTHDAKTNAVMMRNRRIGCSMSGVRQFMSKFGVDDLIKWCEAGYDYIQELDEIYSEWLCVPRSIKTTSIKPSGTVSLLAGATPGVHPFEGSFFIRRVEVAITQDIWRRAQEAGYHVEDSFYKGPNTKIISIPIKDEFMSDTYADINIWEQMQLLAIMQKHWADNQVSITVKFRPDEVKDIPKIMRMYENQIKSVSFLPLELNGAYVQLPMEVISEDRYLEMSKDLKPIDWSSTVIHHDQDEKFCDGEACMIPQ